MKMYRTYSIEDFESFPKKNFKNFSLIEPTSHYYNQPREEGIFFILKKVYYNTSIRRRKIRFNTCSR